MDYKTIKNLGNRNERFNNFYEMSKDGKTVRSISNKKEEAHISNEKAELIDDMGTRKIFSMRTLYRKSWYKALPGSVVIPRSSVKKVDETAILREFANEANEKFFNGKLDVGIIKFSISKKMVSTFGNFKSNRYDLSKQKITISSLIMKDDSWKSTMVHELVHAWQYQTGRNLGHGYSFQEGSRMVASKSEGKYRPTRTSKAPDSVNEFRKAKLQNQFLITKDNQFWFAKSVNHYDKLILEKRGYQIAKVLDPIISIRHLKNISNLFTVRYYYNEKVIKAKQLKLSWI